MASGVLRRGSTIGFISSAAGLGWEANLSTLNEYLDITDFDEASKWAQDHLHADYMWSKKTINAYVAREALGLLKKGIRINSVNPGVIGNGEARQSDIIMNLVARYPISRPGTLDEVTAMVLFVASDQASYSTGQEFVLDGGQTIGE